MSDHNPSHRVYTLLPRGKDDQGKDKSFWLAIGSAWKHSDGAGVNIVLEALPLDGKLVLREIRDDEPEPPAPKGKTTFTRR